MRKEGAEHPSSGSGSSSTQGYEGQCVVSICAPLAASETTACEAEAVAPLCVFALLTHTHTGEALKDLLLFIEALVDSFFVVLSVLGALFCFCFCFVECH